jgi:peroxiredoxin Q/BCP
VLAAGERAPVFEGTTGDGTTFRLADLAGRPVVLYFFPKAGTYGCTRESMDFAHHYEEFRGKGAAVVGISVDTVEAQHEFGSECRLPFPLVADPEKRVAKQYGVLGAFGYARRVTFLIDPEGRVAEVVASAIPSTHVRRALEFLSESKARATPDQSTASRSRDTP